MYYALFKRYLQQFRQPFLNSITPIYLRSKRALVATGAAAKVLSALALVGATVIAGALYFAAVAAGAGAIIFTVLFVSFSAISIPF